MIALGVNIDHVATLREARRTYEPDPLWAAVEAELGGADLITVHLREDRRHIRDEDLIRLRSSVQVPLNLEMAATDEMVAIATAVRPEMATVVPEGRAEITTERGLDLAQGGRQLERAIAALQGAGIRVSLFINPDPRDAERAKALGADCCEVHTGFYAEAFWRLGRRADHPEVARFLDEVRQTGERIQELGMIFNAGHGLTYANVAPVAALSGLAQLHIGHAIVARALLVGMREAVRAMKACIKAASRG